MTMLTRSKAGRAARALVTGAGGFTGRHLAERLSELGYEVWGTTADTGSNIAIPAHAIHALDLLDAQGLHALVSDARPDVVAHLAAASHVTKCIGSSVRI